MPDEIYRRDLRLAKRVRHYSQKFDVPEARFWDALEADPTGPLAATLAKEARRQNIHERSAAEFIAKMQHVRSFKQLPSSGGNALYLNRDGELVQGATLGRARPPSKSIDFEWRTCGLRCIAAQKYTKEGGGNQDNQFKELESLLQNWSQRTRNNTALFVLVDGTYYNSTRLAQLNSRRRLQSPMSYVVSVNDLAGVLMQIASNLT
ncbi:MAG: hypothetical protein OXG15_01325 [Gammaproteobacteria bacterium]|nr:hypothetical protein [Gammaproteobacteria bacterium]